MKRYRYESDGRIVGFVVQDEIVINESFFNADDVTLPAAMTDSNYYDYTYINGVFTHDPVVELVSVDELRVERDKLLLEADKEFIKYIAQREHNNVDRTKSTDIDEDGFTELMMYMQELRDLPKGYVPVANPAYPVFPGIYG